MSENPCSVLWSFPDRDALRAGFSGHESDALLTDIANHVNSLVNANGFHVAYQCSRHSVPDAPVICGCFVMTDLSQGQSVSGDRKVDVLDIEEGAIEDFVTIYGLTDQNSVQLTTHAGMRGYGRKADPDRTVQLNLVLCELVSAVHGAFNSCLTVETNDMLPSSSDTLTNAIDDLEDFGLVIISPHRVRATVQDINDDITFSEPGRLIGMVHEQRNGDLVIGNPERTGG